MRLIDVDKLIDYFKGQCKIAEEDSDPISEYVLAAFKCCIDLFEIFPTEDAEEVVRCRECRFYETAEYYPDGTKQLCRLLKRQMGEDAFCSCGERSTDEKV